MTGYTCKDCGDGFDSKQALGGHRRKGCSRSQGPVTRAIKGLKRRIRESSSVRYEVVHRKQGTRSWKTVKGFSDLEKPVSEESFKKLPIQLKSGYIYAARERNPDGEIGKQQWKFSHRLELGRLREEIKQLEEQTRRGTIPTDPEKARAHLASLVVNGELSTERMEVILKYLKENRKKGLLDYIDLPDEIVIK
ncbi:MAG: hypothetical protein MAG715_00560 [Methanonatronarchaeales archaeon]|nr:hypothetical protein [Methanonatronarchaeales archaeon]